MNDVIEKRPIKQTQSLSLQPLVQELEASKYILTLSENWDDEGALPISPLIYDAATRFLQNYTSFILKKYKIAIEMPSINPVKNGSIDLEWHTPTVQLLINIRDIQNAYFYGDNYNNINPIKGSISVKTVEPFFAAWMLKLRQ
jgi:hypothetical protein